MFALAGKKKYFKLLIKSVVCLVFVFFFFLLSSKNYKAFLSTPSLRCDSVDSVIQDGFTAQSHPDASTQCRISASLNSKR